MSVDFAHHEGNGTTKGMMREWRFKPRSGHPDASTSHKAETPTSVIASGRVLPNQVEIGYSKTSLHSCQSRNSTSSEILFSMASASFSLLQRLDQWITMTSCIHPRSISTSFKQTIYGHFFRPTQQWNSFFIKLVQQAMLRITYPHSGRIDFVPISKVAEKNPVL